MVALRPRSQLILAASLPVICLILAAAAIWPRASRLAAVREEIDSTQGMIQKKQEIIRQTDLAANGRVLALAVAAPGEEEPIEFLRNLAALTTASKAVLVSARSVAATPTPAAPQQTPTSTPATAVSATPVGQGQRPVVPPTVTELADEVTVEGTFQQILTLLVRLESYQRLLSVSRCRISGQSSQSYPRLQATFMLSRFVAAPQPAAAASVTTGAVQP